MRVVIIGGGTAGVSAATHLRRLDENAEILILEQNNELAVSNCGLLYYLSGQIKDRQELIGTTAEEMKRKYNIDVRLNAEVTAINRAEKSVTVKNRDKEYYDKLIFTIGAYQLRPDIEGVLSEQVFTIRNLASIEKIKSYIKDIEPKRAIIVGGGYIGTEAAEALCALGIKPSIVEASSHILPMLDYDMAAEIQNRLHDKGISLYLNKRVEAFEERQVRLADGCKLDYDLAIIATGVKPDLKLSVLSDLEIGETGGLIVNEYMQTSDKDIYSAGDDIEVIDEITRKPSRMSQADLAVKQARIIAEHLCGINRKYKTALSTSITRLCDYTAAAVGANEAVLQKHGIKYEKIHLHGWTHASYIPGREQILLKLLFDKDGKILGAQGIGRNGVDKRLDVLATAIKNNVKVSALEELELCYAPPFGSASDAVNNLGSMADNVLTGKVKYAFYPDFQMAEQTRGAMIVDVRPPEMFAEGHLPQAVNIPVEAIRSNLASFPHDKPVITYCNRGVRAYQAARILQNRGFDNVYVLSGGRNLYLEISRDQTAQNAVCEKLHKLNKPNLKNIA